MPRLPQPFSVKLEAWLKRPGPKTIAGLNRVFAEKSLGIIIFVLMFLPALPLPTGGISHVFEIVAMLLSLQLVVGRRTIWIPARWRYREIRGLQRKKTMSAMLRSVRWLERFSRPRLSALLHSRGGLMIIGILLFTYSLVAFLAPPFSGLDTFPSIGVVIIALSLVLGDAAILLIGIVAGAVGVAIVVGFSTALVTLLQRLL